MGNIRMSVEVRPTQWHGADRNTHANPALEFGRRH